MTQAWVRLMGLVARSVALSCLYGRAVAAQVEGGRGVPNEGPQLRLNGFADIRYQATDTTGSRKGFALGQLDLFMRSLLSDRLGVLSEIVIHPGSRNQFRIVLERVLLTYSASDHLHVAAGRFHTAIGYYNATYHHGTWFQTTTGRPLIAAFEGDGGVLPIHTLGVSLNGTIVDAPVGIRYVVEAGNGRASQASSPVPPQPALGENNTPAFNVGLRVRLERLRGLEVGASFYGDRVTPDTLPPLREGIGAAYLAFHSNTVEILVEAVAMRHHTAGGATTRVDGGYVQASRGFGRLRPYARYDILDASRSDPLFGYVGRRSGPILGVRYEADEFAALKAQFTRLRQSPGRVSNLFEAQAAFTF